MNRTKERSAGEKAVTRRTPIEGAPGGPRKGTYGAGGSGRGSGGAEEDDGDGESTDFARGFGVALLRRTGGFGTSGAAVEERRRAEAWLRPRRSCRIWPRERGGIIVGGQPFVWTAGEI
jgi:hypothetical protein